MMLMFLGVVIGVGLFFGFVFVIKLVGLGILLVYGFSGMIMFFIMRVFGEMVI